MATPITILLAMVLCLTIQASAYKQVRLSGGTSLYEGRVEINHNGEWGTVCDTGWGMNEAKVVCLQLGFRLHTVADTSLEFGPGNVTQPIWMDDVECRGDEYSLDECEADWSESIACKDHMNDAGVICSPYAEGAIRLYGGDSRFDGTVEMYYSGKWGTVCDHGWSGNDVKVACRQLGYPKAKYVLLNSVQYYGPIRYSYIVEDLGCDGYESTLIECRPIDFDPEFCDPYDSAGLVCYETLPEDQDGLTPEAIAGIVVATIFISLFVLCCCAAVCSSNNRKRSARAHRSNQGQINTVYNVESDTASFGYPRPPPPPGPGVNTEPFTPPAGYIPGYLPPGGFDNLPKDAPPAYETLDDINPTNAATTTSSLTSQPAVTVATTNPELPPQLPSMDMPAVTVATTDPELPPQLPSMDTPAVTVATTDPELPPQLPSMDTHPAVAERNEVYE